MWAITGLWHGAAWNYVEWGVYYGALLICEKFIWGKALDKAPAIIGHVYAIAVFVFAKYNLRTLPKIVDLLARCSFGIYLTHPLVIEILAEKGITVPTLWIPALAAAVFAICAIIAAVLTKLPLIRKYLS